VSGAQLADPHVAAAAAYDLGAYLAAPDPSLRRSYSNVQAAHFAQRVHDDPWSLPEPEFLDAAVAALEPYDLVGVYDDIQGFLDIISVDLAVPRAELGKLNITPARRHRDETPAALVAALREVNWVDLRLCEIAWQRFEQAVARAASAPLRVAAPIASPQARPEPAPMREDFGTRELEVLAVRCIGTHTDVSHVPSGEALKVVLECHAWQPVGEFTIGLAVHDRQGQLVYGSNSRLLNMALSATQSGRFEQAFLLDTRLGPGEYFVTATLHRGASHTDGCFHWVRNAASFSIVAFPAAPFEGLLDLRLAADMPGMQRFPAMLDDYRARLQLAGAPARLTAGSLATFEVEAHNAGTQAWLTAGERPIRLSYHWHAEDGSMQVYDGERSELPFDVLPGRSARIRAAVRAPDVPGTYQIRFSLVQEGVAWFDERGTPSADAWIAVE